MNIASDDIEDALIFAFDYKSESWLIDYGVSFHATANKKCLKNDVQCDLKKVYLGNDKTCNIIGKGDIQISFANKTTW